MHCVAPPWIEARLCLAYIGRGPRGLSPLGAGRSKPLLVARNRLARPEAVFGTVL
jgi:hypothetical protein